MSEKRLVDSYDAALFDLDGVVYLGPRAVEDAPETLEQLRSDGIRIGFVTNNAMRTPCAVAEHLRELGITATENDVVNSTQATLRMMADELEPGSQVLVLGTDALTEQLRGAGYRPVSEGDAVAVVQGYNPQTSWALLEAGVTAIQRGAAWYATNPDLTRPTDRGIMPGAGTQIAVVQACVDAEPRIAGKPYRPLLDETVHRLEASTPLFVGDRLDTDIAGAVVAGMDSLLVFTGAHGKHDLAAAPPDQRPTHIGHTTAALLEPPRRADLEGATATCRNQRVIVRDGVAELDTVPEGFEEQLDALWAGLQLGWHRDADLTRLLNDLELLP